MRKTTATKTVPPAPEAEVTITMRLEVAETLQSIVCRVGGEPRGRRAHADEIMRALSGVGVYGIRAGGDVDESNPVCRRGMIYFGAEVTTNA